MKRKYSHERRHTYRTKKRISAKRRAYLSARANRQNRNPDGTFAKGFKKKHPVKRQSRFPTSNVGLLTQLYNRYRKHRKSPKNKEKTYEKRIDAGDISIKGTTKEIDTIKKQIKSNFTSNELESVSRDGILIEVTDLPRNNAGIYLYKLDKKGREHIQIDDEAVDDNETATHEMVHLCRNKDPERRGLQKSLIRKYHDKRKVPLYDVPLEEALTVAETAARTDLELTENQAGYYRYIERLPRRKVKREDALKYKREDAILLKGNTGLKIIGKRAYQRAVSLFPELWIRKLTGHRKKAINRFNKIMGRNNG